MGRIALLACTAALAAADADALYGYAGHHLGHLGYAGHHVVHAAPVHHAVHAVPVHHAVHGVINVANTVGIHGAAPAAIPAVHGAYAGAGRYVANSAGVVHVAKREAEPEADAEALYHSYGGYSLGHRAYSLGHGYGYGHHVGLGYSSLGYGHGYGLGYSRYYGKREAEAEPEADALYGAYGLVMDLDTVHTPLDMADTLAMDMDMGVDMDMGMDMDTMVKQSGIKSAEPWKNN